MVVWHVTQMLEGGAGQYCLRLSTALPEVRVVSQIFLPVGGGGEGVNRLTRASSACNRLAGRALRGFSHRVATAPFHTVFGPEVYRTLHDSVPGDIYHLHGLLGWIGVRGLRALIPRGALVFWTLHDIWPLSGGCVVYQGCEQFRAGCRGCPILHAPWKGLACWEWQAKRQLIREFGIRLIANSAWTADRIRDAGLAAPEGVPIVHPIIEDAYFNEIPTGLREELGIPDDRMVLGLGARSLNDEFKGIPRFLAELARFPDLCQRVTVLLFGDGPIPKPETLDVRLLGRITDCHELARLYRALDVFVSPSRMETFGMTLAESQAVGTPVAAFDVGGVRDATHPSASVLVPDQDYRTLVEQIACLGETCEIAATRSQLLRSWARTRFHRTIVAQIQAEIYRSASSNGP